MIMQSSDDMRFDIHFACMYNRLIGFSGLTWTL